MEQVVINLALQYAKRRGLSKITDEALKYAYETLGIEQKEEEYTGGGIFGMGNRFSPQNLIKSQVKKFAMNKLMGGSSGGIGAGMALPLVGGLALGYMTNPLRKGSYNYNPELQGQIDYVTGLDGYIGVNENSGLRQYGPESVLRGQNVVSGFGTNDYRKQLQNYIDKMESRKKKGNSFLGLGTGDFTEKQQEKLDRAYLEQDNFDWDKVDKDMAKEQEEITEVVAPAYVAPAYAPSPRDNDGGGSSQDNAGGGAAANRGDEGSGWDSSPFARGGIAGINRNRGQLGEILYG
tara:strand:+ start:988 stop:1863 length:876 start_codon:yes stop_codon:yes gene_type:complete